MGCVHHPHTPTPPTGWLHSPEADRALAAFNARADGGRAPLAKEVFFQQDAAAEVGGGPALRLRRWDPCQAAFGKGA